MTVKRHKPRDLGVSDGPKGVSMGEKSIPFEPLSCEARTSDGGLTSTFRPSETLRPLPCGLCEGAVSNEVLSRDFPDVGPRKDLCVPGRARHLLPGLSVK